MIGGSRAQIIKGASGIGGGSKIGGGGIGSGLQNPEKR